MRFHFLIIITLALLGTSCEKEVPAAVVGSTEVDIVFTSPEANATITGNGVEISIEARVDANAMMSGYRVTVTNKETGEILDTIDDLYEQTQYMVHHHWYPNLSQSTPIEIKIEALEQSLLVLGENTLEITCTP